MTNDSEISDILAGIEPAPEAVRPKRAKTAEPKQASGQEDWPTIILDEDPSGSNFLFVGVNGTGYQLKRGVEVTVPLSVLEVLNNAVATRTVQSTVEQGRIESRDQNYLAVPYRIVRFGKG